MGKYAECPHCGGQINLSKLRRHETPAEFFDANMREEKETAEILRQKNIELGSAKRGERNRSK